MSPGIIQSSSKLTLFQNKRYKNYKTSRSATIKMIRIYGICLGINIKMKKKRLDINRYDKIQEIRKVDEIDKINRK